jgi:hypothetical protein
VPAAVAGARRGTDENSIRSATVAVRAVRWRLDAPTAVAGLDEIADHSSSALGNSAGSSGSGSIFSRS